MGEFRFDFSLIDSYDKFNEFALKLFHFQYENCVIYQKYVDLQSILPNKVQQIDQIPFLPISFFKSHSIRSFPEPEQKIFYSSSTTGQTPSKHFIKDLCVYQKSYQITFKQFYGNPTDYVIVALLPSYLERNGSSLIYMVDDLIRQSGSEDSNFYARLSEQELLSISQRRKPGQKLLLLGVTYALLDFCEQINPLNIPDFIVMETGGMKGRRREMIREEVHDQLIRKLGVSSIHSEYGMTELLSQAYSTGNGLFLPPAWMRVLGRDVYDPRAFLINKSAAINIIDLANIYSCAFIATDDVGKVFEDGSFEVNGRLDAREIRGCNLMYEN